MGRRGMGRVEKGMWPDCLLCQCPPSSSLDHSYLSSLRWPQRVGWSGLRTHKETWLLCAGPKAYGCFQQSRELEE